MEKTFSHRKKKSIKSSAGGRGVIVVRCIMDIAREKSRKNFLQMKNNFSLNEVTFCASFRVEISVGGATGWLN